MSGGNDDTSSIQPRMASAIRYKRGGPLAVCNQIISMLRDLLADVSMLLLFILTKIEHVIKHSNATATRFGSWSPDCPPIRRECAERLKRCSDRERSSIVSIIKQ